MRKILLLLALFASVAFSAIDECKTDVYFGNGILTTPDASKSNTILLRDTIIEKFGLDYYKKHIGKVDYAYNRTDGAIIDLLESMVQKIDGTGIENVHKYIKLATVLAGNRSQVIVIEDKS